MSPLLSAAPEIDPDALPVAWLRLDARGRIAQANQALAQWLGEPAEALAGRSFDSLLTPASRVLFQSHIQPLLQLHGRTAEMRLALRGVTGPASAALLYASPTGDGEGSINLVLAPIEQRCRIEDEFLRVKRAADLAPGLVFQLQQSPGGRRQFNYTSQALALLFDCTAEQAGADAERLLGQIHPDDRPAFEQALDGATRRAGAVEVACRVQRAGGGQQQHQWQIAARTLGDGSRLWHGYVADIGERRRLEQAEAERATAVQLARYRSEFLARANHELRTPLNAILGFAQLLGRSQGGDLNPEQRRAMQIIEASGQHLLQLVNQLLDLARLDSPAPHPSCNRWPCTARPGWRWTSSRRWPRPAACACCWTCPPACA